MAKKKKKSSLCSNCLEEFPIKELHLVEFPKFNNSKNKKSDTYKTFICPKCITFYQ